mgnify:CR=1 FL=1|tara:strand:+ start:473 stop:3127 length:2655 start_codon:yes stop_codon:yes gene_type:complete
MSSSFQSTAYQSFAQPVDTFVQPVSVLPKTDMMALAETLQVVNPVLEKFIAVKVEERREEISNKAINDALNSSTKDWADASKYVKSNNLFSSNKLYNKVFQRTKSTILGGALTSTFKTEYENAVIDGKPLSHYPVDSIQFQDWINKTRTKIINSLGDVDADTFNTKFFPFLVNATTSITDIHEKKHQQFQVEKLKVNAVSLAKNATLFTTEGSESDQEEFKLLKASINQFENDINKLGLSSESRSDINNVILKTLNSEAKRIGYETGDVDLALTILKTASNFPYGPEGKFTLLDHPDYIELENRLREEVEDYTYKKETRDIAEQKRIKDTELEEGLLKVANLFDEGKPAEAIALMEKLQDLNPLLATKIQAAGEVLGSGDANTRYAELVFNINEGNYPTLSDARIAIMSWFLDAGTIRNSENTTKLNQLMGLAGSVDKGILEPLNEYFIRYEEQSKLRVDLDIRFKTFKLIGPDQQLATIKLNTEAFKSEFREYKLANPNVGKKELDLKYEELKDKYDKILFNKLNELIDPQNKSIDTNEEFINENQGGLEGTATEDGSTEGGENNNANDFFSNSTLPSVESRVIAELIRRGGITKENKDNLLKEVELELSNMNVFNVTGKAEANRIIRFLQSGEYRVGGKIKIYEPMKLLIDSNNLEAGFFTDDSSPTTVTVEQGDTLSEIAQEFGIPLKAFMEANNITNADLIKAGQELIVPEFFNKTEINTENKLLDNKLPETELKQLKEEIQVKINNKQPLTKEQINKLLLNAGFTEEQAKIMTAIAMAESANKPNAFYSGTEDEPEESYGLFQINMFNYKGMELGNDRKPKLGINNNEDLYDPVLNAMAAKLVFDETQAQKGNGYLAWGVYSKDGLTEDPNAKYKQFLD